MPLPESPAATPPAVALPGSGSVRVERLVQLGMVCAVLLVIYLLLSRRLFWPLIDRTAEDHWLEVLLRPSVWWTAMGFMLVGA